MTREEALNECVSRDKAIVQLNHLQSDWDDDWNVAIRKCIETIKKLPSVTPMQKWIPVSERLPNDLESVNVTWVNHNPESYYADIKDKPFTATAVYFNGQWYWWSTLCTDILAEYSHNYDDVIDNDIEITAWRPLPEPYQPEIPTVAEGSDE